MALLEVKNLSISYQNNRVIRDCSFQLKRGEVTVILGASGDGKTTLMKAIAGLVPRESGKILFQETAVADPTERLVPGHEFIKLVNQDFDLDDYHTVSENIRLRLLQFDEDYRSERVKTLLRLTKLTSFKNQKAKDLSGGQKQRLAIARALADEPELILLDEPFNQLDFQTRTGITSHIKRYLKAHNIGVIMVTHNGLEALEWADRIIHLKKGKIVRVDKPSNFYENPDSLDEARFFGEVNKLKIGEKVVCFRPSFYSESKDKVHKTAISVEFKSQQKMGWYSIFQFTFQGKAFNLYAAKDISQLKKIYLRTFQFSD